jgi:hypothetical protein
MLGSTPLKIMPRFRPTLAEARAAALFLFSLLNCSFNDLRSTRHAHTLHFLFAGLPQNEPSPFVFSVCARRLKAQAELGGALGPLRGALRPLRDLQPLFGQLRPYSCKPRGGEDSASNIPHTQPCTQAGLVGYF